MFQGCFWYPRDGIGTPRDAISPPPGMPSLYPLGQVCFRPRWGRTPSESRCKGRDKSVLHPLTHCLTQCPICTRGFWGSPLLPQAAELGFCQGCVLSPTSQPKGVTFHPCPSPNPLSWFWAWESRADFPRLGRAGMSRASSHPPQLHQHRSRRATPLAGGRRHQEGHLWPPPNHHPAPMTKAPPFPWILLPSSPTLPDRRDPSALRHPSPISVPIARMGPRWWHGGGHRQGVPPPAGSGVGSLCNVNCSRRQRG